MATEIAVELIKIIPTVLWLLFLVFLIVVFYRPIRNELIPRLSGLKVLGVEAIFIKEELTKAASKESAISEMAVDQVTRRAQRLASLILGTQIILVNDVPEEMTHVERILRSLGMRVDIASDTDTALSMMNQNRYDLVVSDMNREGIPDEGIRFLSEIRRRGLHRPTIFSAGNFDPSRGVPPYAFGITNRVDELLNLIFDIIERTRG